MIMSKEKPYIEKYASYKKLFDNLKKDCKKLIIKPKKQINE